jgi:hypothetical protein
MECSELSTRLRRQICSGLYEACVSFGRNKTHLASLTAGQGGASNFAVIISVTVKAYDVLPYTSFEFAYNTTAHSDTFWTMVAIFHQELPQLIKSGLMGYFYVVPIDATERNVTLQGKLYGEWLAPGLTLEQVRRHLAPVEERITTAHLKNNTVSIYGNGNEHPDFTKGFATSNPSDTAGVPVRLGSRLLDEQALSRPLHELKDALRKASGDSAGLPILGHVIAGPGTWSPKGGIVHGSNAVLPAWRNAFMQMGKDFCVETCVCTLKSPRTALPRTWEPLNEPEKTTVTTKLRTEAVQALRDLSPRMGAYANEADPTEPNWQETFYGKHYPRLLSLKKRWDPNGVFWYKSGVGSELWEPRGTYGIENGVGQNPIQLCKAEDEK